MKNYSRFYFLILFYFINTHIQAQVEFTTGFAVNKNQASGFPIHAAYDFKIGKKLYTKSQAGYKYLYHFNDFVGAKLKVSIWEFHQTLSYEVIKKKKYIFKPNIGLNYRYYYWRGMMVPPLNSPPQRVYNLEFRNDWLRLNSYNGGKDSYRVHNLGFTIQLQNQFKLSQKVWLHITPFLEPDYDRTQNTGGCYVGVILPHL